MTVQVQNSLIILAWLVFMPCLALAYMTVPPSPDQSQFDWMAFIAINDRPYYSGSFDMNWPGAMWLHEAGLRVFGVQPWTWRLTDFILLIIFTSCGALFLAKDGWQHASTVFLFLYPPLYVTSGSWMAGQRDIIAAGFLLAACWLATPGYRRESIAVFLAGAFVGAAVLIRPTYLSFLAGLMMLEALPLTLRQQRQISRLGRALRFLSGFLLFFGIVVVAALIAGNLDDWYAQSIQFALSLYVGDPPQDLSNTMHILFIQSWHWISALAVLGVVFWVWRDQCGYTLLLILGVIATCLVSFAVQSKGFGYHLGGVLMAMVLLAAIALDSLYRQCRTHNSGVRNWSAAGLLSFTVLIALTGTGNKLMSLRDGVVDLARGEIRLQNGSGLTEDERRRIIAIIKTESAPDETVAVYGLNYEIAVRSERLPTYRFFTPAADQIQPDFLHYGTWLAEIDTALAQQPPAFVIVERDFIIGPDAKPRAAYPDRPILSRLIAHLETGYIPVFENPRLVVYKAL